MFYSDFLQLLSCLGEHVILQQEHLMLLVSKSNLIVTCLMIKNRR